MATIDEVYIHKNRLYHYTERPSDGWFITNGTKHTWTYDPYEGLLSQVNLFDLKGTQWWEVEEGSSLDCRDAVKTIFHKTTIIEL
jgi:hypothetical protein